MACQECAEFVLLAYNLPRNGDSPFRSFVFNPAKVKLLLDNKLQLLYSDRVDGRCSTCVVDDEGDSQIGYGKSFNCCFPWARY